MKVSRIERRKATAAVDHECRHCLRGIRAGERYIRIVSSIGGTFNVWKYHAPVYDEAEDPCAGDRRESLEEVD